MAVHALSDEVVRWITQTPGIAATRVAYTRQNGGMSYDLILMDADGFGVRRIAGFGGQLYSPTWSPDGRRILYTINDPDRGGWQLIERDVTSGSQRTIRPGGELLMTPTYARDGNRIALATWRNGDMDIIEYDIQQQCCAKPLAEGRGDNLSPVYSPDGRRLGFVSTSLGRAGIYVMPAAGGSPTLLTPFVRGQASEYQGPSWSPSSSKIAFHGHWNMRVGNYQIMVADADRPGGQIEQITARGDSEDPSWAPDGRHLVYTSVGDGPAGLYVIDAETKERRPLAPGGNLRMAEWSPRLVNAADLAVRSGNPNEER
jgi:TolB protein